MGRKLRTTVPILPAMLSPKQPDLQFVKERESLSRIKSKESFDLRHRVREPSPLAIGSKVVVRDLDREAEVVATSSATPRSVVVRDVNGSTLRRNTSSLKSLTPNKPKTPSQTPKKFSSFGRLIKSRKIMDL